MPVSNGLTANLVCIEASPPELVGSGIQQGWITQDHEWWHKK